MVSPKIILNEDYVDLRKCPENSLNSRSNTGTHTTYQNDSGFVTSPNLKSDGVRLEKELINCGLKKLVTSYNATTGYGNTQKLVNKKKILEKEKSKYDPRFRRFLVAEQKNCLKSMSEISVLAPKIMEDSFSTSTPLFPREKTSNIEVESYTKKRKSRTNKFTMTKKADSQDLALLLRHLNPSQGQQRLMANYAKEKINTGYSPLVKENMMNQQSVDPRLCEKYSVLKVPWKRSWTIPVFSHKSAMLNGYKNMDHTDRQTYLYDDGTEIDSIYVEEKQKQIFSNVFQTQFMGLLFLGGSICGILLVSLLVWFIFGFDFFRIFFKPKEIQNLTPRQYFKYMGGSVIYLVTSVFRMLGRVLTTPTQQVYQTPAERNQWSLMQRNQLPRE